MNDQSINSLWLSLCIVLILSPLIPATDANAQPDIDSLIAISLREDKPDTLIKIYEELAYQLRESEPVLSIRYARLSLNLAVSIAQVRGEINACNRLGDAYRVLGKLDSALYYYQQAYRLEMDDEYLYGLARSANNLGIIYRLKNDYAAAIPYYKRAATIFKSIEEPDKVSTANYNIADCFNALGQTDSALIYLQSVFDLEKESKQLSRVARSYQLAGAISVELAAWHHARDYLQKADSVAKLIDNDYIRAPIANTKGLLYQNLNHQDSAYDAFTRSIALYSSSNQPRLGTEGPYLNRARLLYYLDSIDRARNDLQKALTLALKFKSPKVEAEAYNIIGLCLRSIGQLDSAKFYFKKSIATYRSLGLGEVLGPMYNLSLIFETIGRYDSALRLRKQYYYLYEESEELKQNSIAYRQKIEKQKTALQLANLQLKNERLRYMGIIGIITALAILFFLIFYNRYQKRKAELALNRALIQKQQEKIQGEQDTKARIARDIHDELGNMLKMVKHHFDSAQSRIKGRLDEQEGHFNKATYLLGQALEYSRNVAKELLPAVLKDFGLLPALKEIKNSLDGTNGMRVILYTVNMEGRMQSWIEQNIYFIVRELAGNAINHAQATQLTIQLIRLTDAISVTVEDNGIGFDHQAEDKQQGMGMKNLKERIEAMEGKLIIDSRIAAAGATNPGTSILIEIPLKQTNLNSETQNDE